jgi:hypothetical protein
MSFLAALCDPLTTILALERDPKLGGSAQRALIRAVLAIPVTRIIVSPDMEHSG